MRGCLAVQSITGSWARELPSLGVKWVRAMLGFLCMASLWLPGTFQLPHLFPDCKALLFLLSHLLFSLSSSPLLLFLFSLSSLLPSPLFSLSLSLALLPVFPSLCVGHLRVSLATELRASVAGSSSDCCGEMRPAWAQSF